MKVTKRQRIKNFKNIAETEKNNSYKKESLEQKQEDINDNLPSLSRVERLVARLEAMKIGDYLDVLQKPSKIIWTNFLAGVFRGLGMAIGASLVFALILDFLKEILLLNIPGIGDFIAQIINLVEKKTNTR